jgi:hypothetical protein
MTLNFLSKRRHMTDCSHKSQMKIEIAGMSREVCESCGKVTVSFVDEHFSRERAQELAERSVGADDTSDKTSDTSDD